MEHDYMCLRGPERGNGPSGSLKLMVKSHMMLFDMVKLVKGTLMSLGFVYFHIHSLMLIHDQINNTEHYS